MSASGKSTFAKQFIKENNNWLIVNRDSIRRMFGEYWVPSRENVVADSEFVMLKIAISYGWNVVVDDSNLDPYTIRYLELIAQSCDAEIEFKKFDIPLDELLRRDANRENPVGEEVIRKFYNKYYEGV